MINKEFLNEAHILIDDLYREFEEYQDITNEILLVFHEICEKNNIYYSLAFGSLIGAIRDKGHIPWDYDVDVVIPFYDKEKLLLCLEEQLGQEYYYTYVNNVTNYPTSCIRICKKGYSFTAVHVDVFILIGCPNDLHERNLFIKCLNYASYLRGIKYSPEWFPRELGGGKLEKLACIVDKFRAALIPKLIIDYENKLMKQYPLGTTDYCFIVGDLRYRKCHQYKWFQERIKVPVDGHMLYVPIGYNSVLKNIYGDFLTYLPIQVRFDEFYNTLKVIRKRNRIRGGKFNH